MNDDPLPERCVLSIVPLCISETDENFVTTRGIDFENFVFSGDEMKNALMQRALEDKFQRTVDDGAHVFILGCTGFPVADKVKARMKRLIATIFRRGLTYPSGS